jgi:hypothetical protein
LLGRKRLEREVVLTRVMTQIVVVFYTLPPSLPPFVLKEIEKIEELNPYHLDSLILTLQDFFKDFQCPLLSPLTLINFTNPLENR